jgi:hypothetical protein
MRNLPRYPLASDVNFAWERNTDSASPRFVVWAGQLKSLRSVTVRKPLLVEIGFIRQFLNGRYYHKKERPSHPPPPPKAAVEHSIGNGEVDSSILSGSTIHSLAKALKIKHNSRFRSIVGFGHYSHFEQNRP